MILDKLEAIIAPEAIAMPGTYIVTLKRERQALRESHRDHFVVGIEAVAICVIEDAWSGSSESTKIDASQMSVRCHKQQR